jgi:hypothetical protein
VTNKRGGNQHVSVGFRSRQALSPGDFRRSKHPWLRQKVVRSRGRLNGSLGASRSANSDSPGPISSSRARQRVRGRVTNWPLPQRTPVRIRSTGRVGAWAPVDLFGDRALPLAAPTGQLASLKKRRGREGRHSRACLCLTVFARAPTGSVLSRIASWASAQWEVRLALSAPWSQRARAVSFRTDLRVPVRSKGPQGPLVGVGRPGHRKQTH